MGSEKIFAINFDSPKKEGEGCTDEDWNQIPAEA